MTNFHGCSPPPQKKNQLIYRPDTGEILGVHILGLHAADLIHEASNAIALGTRIQACVLNQYCLLTCTANYVRACVVNCLRTWKSILRLQIPFLHIPLLFSVARYSNPECSPSCIYFIMSCPSALVPYFQRKNFKCISYPFCLCLAQCRI